MGYSVQGRQGAVGEGPAGATKRMRGWSISLVRRPWELGLFKLETKGASH